MRQVTRFSFWLCLLTLVGGCTGLNPKNFDPTHFWKLNRGDNYMNDDGYYSVPVANPKMITSPASPPAHSENP
mgnify:CR=1 FL=1